MTPSIKDKSLEEIDQESSRLIKEIYRKAINVLSEEKPHGIIPKTDWDYVKLFINSVDDFVKVRIVKRDEARAFIETKHLGELSRSLNFRRLYKFYEVKKENLTLRYGALNVRREITYDEALERFEIAKNLAIEAKIF